MKTFLCAALMFGLAGPLRAAPNPDQAQKALENAVRAEPDDANAWRMLGLIYEKKGLKAQAKEAWKNCADKAKEPSVKELALKHVKHLEATGAK